MRTLDEFVQAEVERLGKRVYTVLDVIRMADRYRAECIAAAAPFEGWREEDNRPDVPDPEPQGY